MQLRLGYGVAPGAWLLALLYGIVVSSDVAACGHASCVVSRGRG